MAIAGSKTNIQAAFFKKNELQSGGISNTHEVLFNLATKAAHFDK